MIPPRCLIVQGHLGRFVDGALPGARARSVREHLQVCARCLEAERMARAIPVMLSSCLDPPTPPALLPRLLTSLRRRRRRRRATATTAAFVLLVLLTCAAVAGTRSGAEPQRVPSEPMNAASPARAVVDDPAASLAGGRPSTATLGAAPSLTRTLTPPVNVGQFTVPNLASACPARKTDRAGSGQTVTCQSQATPARRNRP